MMRHGIGPRYDVVVAGARCAGASTALLLARRGLRVLVVDPTPVDRDVLSTHALMRGAVLQLHRWGLLDAVRAAGTPALTATTFDYGSEVVTVPLEARDGVDALYAPRRTVLDPILADAAEEAGAHVVRGWSVKDLLRDPDGRVRGAWLRGPRGQALPVRASLVVGADGARSRVARLVSAPVEHQAAHTTASVYGYWRGLAADGYRWTFRPGVGIGWIPTNDGDACVFVSATPARFEAARSGGLEAWFHETVAAVDPDLAGKLAPAARSGGLRGFAGLRGFLRRAHGPGWALVGDAGYFKDPLTAHGITDALRDAELLADAVANHPDDLSGYQARRDRAARGLMDVTDRIAALDWTLDEVKALHRRLSREMKAGLDVLDGVESVPTAAGSAA